MGEIRNIEKNIEFWKLYPHDKLLLLFGFDELKQSGWDRTFAEKNETQLVNIKLSMSQYVSRIS